MKTVLMWMVDRIRAMTGEDRLVALFGASFFVGVWYAFPMVNTITDVWAFGGGVLRAMEAHSVLPGYGVAYGTVSFYQNYIAMIIALGVALPFYGFDVDSLKMALVLNPAYSLLVPRIVSAATAFFVLVCVYRFLKTCVTSTWWRFALLVLVFGNVLAALLVRSGKMWILSIGLGVVSFIYLYRALADGWKVGTSERYATVSIVTAFLATANFTFAGLFLVNVPILFFAAPHTRVVLQKLIYAVVAGAVCFALFFMLNAGNTITQLSEFIVPLFDPSARVAGDGHARLTFFESLAVNLRQAIEAFPLLLLAAVIARWGGLRDQLLARLALLYMAIYVCAVAFIFRTDHGLALNIRHIFPLCFFLMFYIAAHRPPARRVAVLFLALGLVVYCYSIFLFSVPTTYNAAADFIVERYGDAPIRIDEDIFELTLPMNKASYELFATSSCGSACMHTRTLSRDRAFRPIVVTDESDGAMVAYLPPPDVIILEHAVSGCRLIASFGNDVPDNEVYDMDINLGRMVVPSFYRLDRLGKNIYVYDATSCDASPLRSARP